MFLILILVELRRFIALGKRHMQLILELVAPIGVKGCRGVNQKT